MLKGQRITKQEVTARIVANLAIVRDIGGATYMWGLVSALHRIADYHAQFKERADKVRRVRSLAVTLDKWVYANPITARKMLPEKAAEYYIADFCGAPNVGCLLAT